MANTAVRRMVECRRRGWVGFAFVVLFWAFNAVMALWMAGIVQTGWVHRTAAYTGVVTSEFTRSWVPAAMVALAVWAAGAVVFGALMMATRGTKEMVELRD